MESAALEVNRVVNAGARFGTRTLSNNESGRKDRDRHTRVKPRSASHSPEIAVSSIPSSSVVSFEDREIGQPLPTMSGSHSPGAAPPRLTPSDSVSIKNQEIKCPPPAISSAVVPEVESVATVDERPQASKPRVKLPPSVAPKASYESTLPEMSQAVHDQPAVNVATEKPQKAPTKKSSRKKTPKRIALDLSQPEAGGAVSTQQPATGQQRLPVEENAQITPRKASDASS